MLEPDRSEAQEGSTDQYEHTPASLVRSLVLKDKEV